MINDRSNSDTPRLIDAEVLIRDARSDYNLETLALWTGYRPGVPDAIAPESFDGLLYREVDGLLRITKSGYIAGRAGMTTTEVMDQLERERHEAVARMTGIGLIPARAAGKG